MKKSFNKTLPLFRKNDKNVNKLIDFKRNFNKLTLVWSKHLREKIKFSKYIFRNKIVFKI